VLALHGKPMDLDRLLDREELLRALEPHRPTTRGAESRMPCAGLDRSQGVLLDGVAMGGSLRSCPEALRLDDVMGTNGLVPFSRDVATTCTPRVKWRVGCCSAWAGWSGQLSAIAEISIKVETQRALLLAAEVGPWGRRHGIWEG
jgi:hypothetical protein